MFVPIRVIRGRFFISKFPRLCKKSFHANLAEKAKIQNAKITRTNSAARLRAARSLRETIGIATNRSVLFH
jgi:hypothetical protein